MVRKGRSSIEEILTRQKKLGDIIVKYHEDNKEPSNNQLIKSMREIGYDTYNYMTLNRDMKHINRQNTFVRDLAESNYSYIVETQMNKLTSVQKTVDSWEQSPPEIIRRVMRAKRNPNFDHTDLKRMQDEKIAEWIYEPETAYAETISPITIQSMKKDLAMNVLRVFNGDIIDTSIAMITSKFDEMQEQIDRYEMQEDDKPKSKKKK